MDSELNQHTVVVREERVPTRPITAVGLFFLIFGFVILLLGLGLGVNSANPEFVRRTMFSWHFAYMVCFTISAGALFWVLLHAITNSGWGVLVRRQMENLSLLIIPVAVFAVPFLLFKDKIFYWLTLKPGYDPLLDSKAFYLNEKMFLLRAVGYFVVLISGALLFRHLSVSQDRDGDPVKTVRARQWSALYVPLFAITITFSAIDWMMSLDHHWFSTMWGVYIFAGSAWSSMALLILLCNALRSFGYFKNVFTQEHNHIMGKLLFAFTVFWAYVAFSQYMLIYYANIPEETWFYIHRNLTFGIDPVTEQPILKRNSWFWMSVSLVIFHFFVPFLLLLTQPAKRSTKRLSFVCVLALVMHVVDIYYIIMPMEQVISAKKALKENPVQKMWQTTTGVDLHVFDVVFLLGMAMVLLGSLLCILPRASLFPVRDPRLRESLQLTN